MLQPADVATFKPMKSMWKKSVLEWRRENPTASLSLDKMAALLAIAIDKFSNDGNIVKNGFKACGLYPWDPNAVDYSKCLGATTKKNKKKKRHDRPSSSIVLSFKAFSRIIGNDMVKELELFSPETNILEVKSDEFRLLHKLLQEYKIMSTLNATNKMGPRPVPNEHEDKVILQGRDYENVQLQSENDEVLQLIEINIPNENENNKTQELQLMGNFEIPTESLEILQVIPIVIASSETDGIQFTQNGAHSPLVEDTNVIACYDDTRNAKIYNKEKKDYEVYDKENLTANKMDVDLLNEADEAVVNVERALLSAKSRASVQSDIDGNPMFIEQIVNEGEAIDLSLNHCRDCPKKLCDILDLPSEK